MSGNVGLEKALDLYVCSESDVFVPAISGMFYGSVTGKRIASGRSQILVPAQISGSFASASDFISSYVSTKNHLAYSCYCWFLLRPAANCSWVFLCFQWTWSSLYAMHQISESITLKMQFDLFDVRVNCRLDPWTLSLWSHMTSWINIYIFSMCSIFLCHSMEILNNLIIQTQNI